MIESVYPGIDTSKTPPNAVVLYCSQPEFSEVLARDLIVSHERLQRMEMVPLESILLHSGTFDPARAKLLQNDMKEKGQISPIIVRARLSGQNELVYDLIDGYHRTHAKINEGAEIICATVWYGLSDEEMFDERMLAVDSVRSVQVPRLARWMKEVFLYTPWHETLTVTQVFSLASNKDKKQPVEQFGLSKQDIASAREWAIKKAHLANKKPSWIYKILQVADATSDDLISQVRTEGGGHEGRGVLTLERLRQIALPLNGEYELQRRLVDLVIDQDIKAEHAGQLALQLANVAHTPDKVTEILTRPFAYTTSTSDRHANIPTPEPTKVEVAPFPDEERQKMKQRIKELQDRNFVSLMSSLEGFKVLISFVTWLGNLSEQEQTVAIYCYKERKSDATISELIGSSPQEVKDIRDKIVDRYTIFILKYQEDYQAQQRLKYQKMIHGS